LAVERAQRLANAAQRKALALRDRGCIIPGCHIPPDQCQPHHVTDWARSGRTDLENMALLCWPHHRQVELHQWLIGRGSSADGPRWNVVQTPRSTWRPRR
jgi:hypothetical protein